MWLMLFLPMGHILSWAENYMLSRYLIIFELPLLLQVAETDIQMSPYSPHPTAKEKKINM